jgi:hypothetical protein
MPRGDRLRLSDVITSEVADAHPRPEKNPSEHRNERAAGGFRRAVIYFLAFASVSGRKAYVRP